MSDVMLIDASLYDCDDCIDEALMDIGIINGDLHIPRSQLDAFNEYYKNEFDSTHGDQGYRIRKWRKN